MAICGKVFIFGHGTQILKLQYDIPDAPCMDYLPTSREKRPHSMGNVGKYILHGASGYVSFKLFGDEFYMNIP